MGFNCGIVGLPNVGKSTIFNALSAAGAEAANYPFCTIEPNTGIVPVQDNRLNSLSQIVNSAKTVPTAVEFVDIAGLVKGASKGEGLGNQFLGHIRSVDAIVHVVRCFDDGDIVHVDGSVDPLRDVEIIETELLLADLAAMDKKVSSLGRAAKSGDKELKKELEIVERARILLNEGVYLRKSGEDVADFLSLGLLTAKPILYVANVDEGVVTSGNKCEQLEKLKASIGDSGSEVIALSGALENEIIQLPESEREEFITELGLERSALSELALAGYNLLNLITFFTCGPKETRAWTCVEGSLAPQAAGRIHTDFETGFIRAEVIAYDDFVNFKGEQGAKEKGLLRVEGKDYKVCDGDVMHFRFNV